jgi:hypothetical protein
MGQCFAALFCKALERYKGAENIVAITADNASSNESMAQAIQNQTGGLFNAEKDLLGCAGHVLNLVAQEGLALFGKLDPNEDDLQTNHHSPKDIGNLVTEPDEGSVDLSSIYKRLHGLARYTCATPQSREEFRKFISLFPTRDQPQDSQKQCLILDVRTRWNSTFAMFKRALLLQSVSVPHQR